MHENMRKIIMFSNKFDFTIFECYMNVQSGFLLMNNIKKLFFTHLYFEIFIVLSYVDNYSYLFDKNMY